MEGHQEEVDEGDDQELIEEEVMKGNVDEGEEVVLENSSKKGIKYEYLGQYNV